MNDPVTRGRMLLAAIAIGVAIALILLMKT